MKTEYIVLIGIGAVLACLIGLVIGFAIKIFKQKAVLYRLHQKYEEYKGQCEELIETHEKIKKVYDELEQKFKGLSQTKIEAEKLALDNKTLKEMSRAYEKSLDDKKKEIESLQRRLAQANEVVNQQTKELDSIKQAQIAKEAEASAKDINERLEQCMAMNQELLSCIENTIEKLNDTKGSTSCDYMNEKIKEALNMLLDVIR